MQLPTATKTIRLDLAKAAMLVVDMQNDFCHPDGWLAQIGVDVTPARRPIDPLNSLLPVLRTAQVPVIWLNWGNRPDLLNIGAGLRHVYNPTGEGVGLGDPLPHNGAHVLTQSSWAAAVVDELVISPTDICIDNFLGYDCILLEDCTATTSPNYCLQATLYNVKQCFGFVSDSPSLRSSLVQVIPTLSRETS